MKKTEKGIIWGRSNYSGFEIGYRNIEVKTSNFGLKGLLKLAVVAVGVYLAINYAVSFFVSDKTLIVLGAIYVICMFYYFDEQSNEWHAAEHKIINLLESLESDDELTMENLVKSSSCSQECGEKNKCLKDPSSGKLQEALKAGREYLEKKKSPGPLSFLFVRNHENSGFCIANLNPMIMEIKRWNSIVPIIMQEKD